MLLMSEREMMYIKEGRKLAEVLMYSRAKETIAVPRAHKDGFSCTSGHGLVKLNGYSCTSLLWW